MISFNNLFKFCTTKIIRTNEYKIPALDPSQTKNNLIWLHGMFDSSKNQLKLASNEKLRELTNQTLIDARNHGLSEHTDTITFKNMAVDLIEYIDKRNMKDLFLMGHSMGGRTILTALNDYQAYLQDRVKGVIIVDVMPTSYAVEGTTGPVVQMHRFLKEMKQISISGRKFQDVEKEVKQKFEQQAIAQTVLNNIQILPSGELKWCVNFEAFERSYKDIIEHETKDCYWQGPRKIIIGGKSKFTSAERVAKDYPSVFHNFNIDKDLVIFQDSAHFLYAKEPKRFINEITNFIQEVDEESDVNMSKQQKYLNEEALSL